MDRLQLYNSALLLCRERKLASLSEDREPTRLLDHVWDTDGVDRCLEAGQWQFAMRTVELEYSPSVEPTFGFQRAFDKPTDFVRTCAVCTDEFFQNPLNQYTEEAGFWFADIDTIYVKYVSNDSSYGSDMSLWTASFARFAEAYFAAEIVTKLTQDQDIRKEVKAEKAERLKEALSRDAMAEPAQFFPVGSWVNARGRRRDRENG